MQYTYIVQSTLCLSLIFCAQITQPTDSLSKPSKAHKNKTLSGRQHNCDDLHTALLKKIICHSISSSTDLAYIGNYCPRKKLGIDRESAKADLLQRR